LMEKKIQQVMEDSGIMMCTISEATGTTQRRRAQEDQATLGMLKALIAEH
uniref:Copper homeostasis protein CutC n=1 Tax=Angiostrongylus cantonensis TaxID=6313 RepID=A0A0K0DFT6_ANGCA